jgi:NAD(P)-dependent dehydrogenase (short-subunit alcohol dehydrogenase family)
MRGLKDKVGVVAGGGRGIGAATAQRLAEEGAAVVIGDITVTVTDIRGDRVKIGIEAPRDISVRRSELPPLDAEVAPPTA